ncbi:MAG: hypothetical protein LBL06_05170 [Treponema sp.]|nr:hypothetical protein [Treponema sp.]
MRVKNLFWTLTALLALTFAPTFFSCDSGDGGGNDNVSDGIDWQGSANGTLAVVNDTPSDMVLFQGQTPLPSSILGGVRATSKITIDLSTKVDDFNVGGYIIIRGMKLSEYQAHKNNLANAKVDYSAMATYGQGRKYQANISPNWTGEYYYKVTNKGRLGIELHKDSPDGEKIGYLPALATNYTLYASSTDSYTIYPVYVFYNKMTNEVTPFKPQSLGATASIGPRPVTDNTVATVQFPADNTSWENMIQNISYPNAFIKITNNVPNQAARFQKTSTYMKAQNGYDAMNSGEMLTFEVASNDAGTNINLVCTLYGGTVVVPVRFAGQNTNPTIKNGYDYTVELNLVESDTQAASSYTATLTEGAKRDIENLISSL